MDTNARNAVARGLYKKLGYKEIGIVPTPAELTFYTDLDFEFNDPVVADPLRQNVYSISKELISRPEWAFGGIVLNPFHFTDYPLFITDRKALED